MALPTLSKNGIAADMLGLGEGLQQQVTDETEEQRKKRLAAMQGGITPDGSMAVPALFGASGKSNAGY